MGRIWRLVGCVILVGWLAACSGQPASVIVEWSTETEVDTVGFNLYRATAPEGPFVQVNDELIPSAADPLVGGRYVYTDSAVIAGQVYYYELEDIDASGARTRHGPIVVRAQATWPAWVWAIVAALLTAIAALLTAAVAWGWKAVRRARRGD